MFTRYGIILILSFYVLQGRAQPFLTKIYTANDGLPDSYTFGIFQDKQGYLWIGTQTGLCRFNGQKFVNVETGKSGQRIIGNIVLEDSRNRLWVGANNTVSVITRDSIISFPSSDSQLNYIYGAYEFSNGKIWSLTSGGAYEFTGSRWNKVPMPAEFQKLPCRQVIETPGGIYVNFGWRVAKLLPDGRWQTIIRREYEEAFFISMYMRRGNIYVNTRQEMLKIEGEKVSSIFRAQLKDATSYNFLLDSRGRFWISTNKHGILVSDPDDEDELKYTINLPFNQTTFLTEDRVGNIWATNYEGLVKINDIPFVVFNKNSGDMYENIRCLTTDKDGRLLFATSGKGLYKMHGDDTRLDLLTRQFADDVVDGIDFNNSNEAWLVTRFRKLFKLQGNQLIEYTSKLPDDGQLLYAVNADNFTGKVLISAGKLYVGDETGFKTWGESFNKKELEKPGFISRFKDGSIWVATRDSGIYKLSPDGVEKMSEKLSLSYKGADLKFFEDDSENCWFMIPGQGIHLFERKGKEFIKKMVLTTRDGLPNNHIYAAAFDRQQRLWISTPAGLAIINYDKKGSKVQVTRVGRELSQSVLSWGTSGMACDRNNNMWVSTFHELIRFDVNRISMKQVPPAVSIENIRLNGKETSWTDHADSVAGYFQIPVHPRLRYSENSIAISYEGISFSARPELQYSYSLRSGNEDTGWSQPSSNSEVSFLRLPPGDYQFLVRAREAGEVWTAPQLFNFEIRAPFWKTWTFRILVILLIAAIIGGLARMRINRVRRKAALQKQLHELEMKALKAQMNPHFIYNALNSIQSLIADNKQQESLRYISKFAKLLRQVLEHSDNHLTTLDKELSTLDLYVQLEKLRLNMELQYTLEIDDAIIPESELVPPLILQPYVENALWHGLHRKEGQKSLSIRVVSDNDWITAIITDNGIGRKKAMELKQGKDNYPKSMGMDITARRLKAVNGRTAEQLVTITDLCDQNNLPAGTEVRVRIRRNLSAD